MTAYGPLDNRRLGFHWLWFLPLCAAVLAVVERHTIAYAFGVLGVAYHRWSWWGYFTSPAAHLCSTILILSVIMPLYLLAGIAEVIKSPDSSVRQRWLLVCTFGVVIFVSPFLFDTLIWGSFPFPVDEQGAVRVRMLPFFPWPDEDFSTY